MTMPSPKVNMAEAKIRVEQPLVVLRTRPALEMDDE